MDVGKITHAVSAVHSDVTVGDLDVAPTPMWTEDDEEIGNCVTRPAVMPDTTRHVAFWEAWVKTIPAFSSPSTGSRELEMTASSRTKPGRC
ncbi:hypothetical protein H8B02_18185 [Bradyrhizobium sp. Pear77]|uniref:hypothetical protein n=1 Tax=Bradyrhizobium TaxID=374 RepID=UPI001E57D309|nr:MULTISPECIES: hypothetical protein [Bradyrhizobium]MCC8955297.1 hypothetical protein [Bradyrhizobium altum]MCC8962286.1 hypothetical protein [Bradyrhizobium oropedii]